MNIDEIIKLSDFFRNTEKIMRCENSLFLIRGPEYPFTLHFDKQVKLLILTTYDIAMLDFDDFKKLIPKQLEKFLETNNDSKLKNSDLCFKLYETDNGIHAFIISHRISHNSKDAISLALQTHADYNYIAMCYVKGYNVRMSPKFFNNSSDQIHCNFEKQFVSKLGVDVDGKRIVYIGNKNKNRSIYRSFCRFDI